MLYAKALHQVVHEYLVDEAAAQNTTVDKIWPTEEKIRELTVNGTHIVQAIIKNQSYQSKKTIDTFFFCQMFLTFLLFIYTMFCFHQV